MTDKDIRQWYDAHGIEFKGEDWGPRGETGESSGRQNADPDRVGRDYVVSLDPAELYAHDDGSLGDIMLLWEQREDHEVLEAIEEFFAPYMSLMPFSKRRVLDEYLLARRTQADLAAEAGVSQQAVSKQLASAVRWLTRTIATDYPDRIAITDVAAQVYAWAVFNEFWLDRFGTPWPLKS